MALILTEEQKKYINTHGPMDAETLKLIFEQSVLDQEKLRKQAAKIRNKKKS